MNNYTQNVHDLCSKVLMTIAEAAAFRQSVWGSRAAAWLPNLLVNTETLLAGLFTQALSSYRRLRLNYWLV